MKSESEAEDVFSASDVDSNLFGEKIYARAKPYFDAALRHGAGDDVQAAMTQLLYALKNAPLCHSFRKRVAIPRNSFVALKQVGIAQRTNK